ncbi:hypothetical protein VTH82DRAFT_6293 [Thermothelomyces myriococcoides]
MEASTKTTAAKLKNEIDTMMLANEQTHIPVPKVSGSGMDDNSICSAFALTEFLAGDIAVDLDGGYQPIEDRFPRNTNSNFIDLSQEFMFATPAVYRMLFAC